MPAPLHPPTSRGVAEVTALHLDGRNETETVTLALTLGWDLAVAVATYRGIRDREIGHGTEGYAEVRMHAFDGDGNVLALLVASRQSLPDSVIAAACAAAIRSYPTHV